LETYTELKVFVPNPDYQIQKQKALYGLTDDKIDRPIVDLVHGFNRLPHCFTLQTCYGHFVYDHQPDQHNLEPLPVDKEIKANIEYRIAYIAFCIENSTPGLELFESLKTIPAIDPQYVQFCCAQWFWDRQVNSFALQVEPDGFKDQDTAEVNYKEALYIEKIRDEFFRKLYKLIKEISI